MVTQGRDIYGNATNKIKTSLKGLLIKNGSYYLQTSVVHNGKSQRLQMTLGRVNEITRQQAEQLAIDNKNKAREVGVDVVKEKLGKVTINSTNTTITLDEVIDEYLERPELAEATRRKTKRLKKYWTPLLQLPVKTIDKFALRKWYNEIKEYAEKKDSTIDFDALRKLHTMFQFAIECDYIDYNLVNTITTSKLLKRKRPPKRKTVEEERLEISSGELSRFVYGLLTLQPKTKKANFKTGIDIILTYLLTGGRYTEIRMMRWSWFDSLDLETGFNSFTAPPKTTDKGKKINCVKMGKKSNWYPLCLLLKDLFKQRYKNRVALSEAMNNKAPLDYVFPNSMSESAFTNPKGRIEEICNAVGINKKISHHSFRYTFTDIVEKISPHLEDDALHHTPKSLAKQVYANRDERKHQLRKLFQDIEDFISTSIPVVYDVKEGKTLKKSGVETISLVDNQTSVSERVVDKKAFRDVYMGRKDLFTVYNNIPFVREEILAEIKKKFPKVRDTYFQDKENIDSFKAEQQKYKSNLDMIVKEFEEMRKQTKAETNSIQEYEDSIMVKAKEIRRKFNINLSSLSKLFNFQIDTLSSIGVEFELLIDVLKKERSEKNKTIYKNFKTAIEVHNKSLNSIMHDWLHFEVNYAKQKPLQDIYDKRKKDNVIEFSNPNRKVTRK